MSGESRTELLIWVNDLLKLNYTKVEQLGSGAAYCQIFDSIFLDLPMSKVNFNASREYEYLNNFKVLQSSFQKHKVQKPIPVERLIKCRFQDNLEFFQWIRKFWLENTDESEYDPLSRRKATAPTSTPALARRSTAPVSESRRVSTSSATPTSRQTSTSRRVTSGTTSTSSSSTTLSTARRVTSSSSNTSTQSNILPKGRNSTTNSTMAPSRTMVRSTSTSEVMKELEVTKNDLNTLHLVNQEYEETIKALEIERNFYYNKLRSIEVVNETVFDMLKNPNHQETPEEQSELLKAAVLRIHDLLYMLADGFEVPGQESDTNDYNNQTTEYSESQMKSDAHGIENGKNHMVDMDIDADTF